jgi:hypothetical protein
MKVLRLVAGLFASSSLFLAAQPVATVTSSAAFELQGHEVNVKGIPSWPVAAGDVVATHSSPATIQLREGTRITLLSDSRARIDSTTEDGLKIDLLAGRLQVGSNLPRQVSIYVDGKIAKASSGVVLASHNQAPVRAYVPSHTRVPDLPTPVSSK